MISLEKMRLHMLVLIGVLSCVCIWDSSAFPKSFLALLCMMPFLLALRNIIREKRIKKFFIEWYGLFVLFVAMSLLYTVNHIDAKDVVRRCILCFGLGFSASQLIRDSRDIKVIMKGIILGACLTFVVTLKMESHLIGVGRLGSITCGAATSFAEILLIGLFCLFLLEEKRMLIIFFQIFLFSGILLSGSRMPLVFAVLCFMIKRFMDVGVSRKMFFTLIGTGALVLCLGFAVMNNPVLYEILGSRIDSTLDTMKYGVDKKNDASLQYRSDMKKEAMKLWRTAPLIGHGVNSFCELSPVTNKRASSHCGFTEILCSFGIVGFFLFFRPFVKPLKLLIMRRKSLEAVMLLFFLIMEWQSSDFAASAYVCFCYVLFCRLQFKQMEQREWA